ncbi:tail protein X [Paraburkholderia sp.]|uniref:tail protein X n=1 Tax=Paraburkholderia sp. TaxID=1926495 RepID=UPI002D3DF43E|nr:tail protein X [Paraburkholderia sp.]HEV2607725.1 tail protein X [Xanthomonadaceae bacterium]HZZ05378.1 tail protein X [Paraburkholderia sp.]
MSAQTYTTTDGDVVDEIAFKHYGACTAGTLAAVLEANPGLADRGAILPAGVVVVLPSAAPITSPVTTGLALWD